MSSRSNWQLREAEIVAYELSEDSGKVGRHKLNARPCSVCGEQIKHGERDVRFYTRPKRHKGKPKGVMHNYHFTRTRQGKPEKEGKTNMAGPPIRTKLIHYLRQHPGIEVFADEIAEALGESRKRVMSGMGNLLAGNQEKGAFAAEFAQHVEKLEAGVWRYRPPGVEVKQRDQKEPKEGKRVFQEVGTTKEGWMVLECEDGKLARADWL